MVAAVLYAAKSTADKRGSIPDQLARTRAAAEAEGRQVVGEFSDEGFSAYRGNRGDGLVNAREMAEQLAANVQRAGHLAPEVWCLHSDRLARGAGAAPGDALHLVEYVLWARRAGVRLRSVEDDATFGDLLHAVVMGDRNSEDSRRKSLAVKAGMERRAMRGLHHGGPPPFGYRVERELQIGSTLPISTRLVAIESEVRVVRRIYAARLAGQSQRQIVRDLNADGIPAPRGSLWKQATVRAILLNPAYAGRIRHRGQIVAQATHEPLVDEATWLSVQADLSTPVARGRPSTEPFLLRGLLRCGRCGHAMVTRTVRNRRGSTYAVYRCLGRIEGGPEFCSQAPVPREVIDRAVVDFFLAVGVDVEETRRQLRAAADDRLAMLADLIAEANTAHVRYLEALERTHADYDAGHLPSELYAETVKRQTELAQASRAEADRLRDHSGVIAAEVDSADGIDQVNELLGEIRGAVDREAVEATAQAIRRVFQSFTLTQPRLQLEVGLIGPEDALVPAGRYVLESQLNEQGVGAVAITDTNTKPFHYPELLG